MAHLISVVTILALFFSFVNCQSLTIGIGGFGIFVLLLIIFVVIALMSWCLVQMGRTRRTNRVFSIAPAAATTTTIMQAVQPLARTRFNFSLGINAQPQQQQWRPGQIVQPGQVGGQQWQIGQPGGQPWQSGQIGQPQNQFQQQQQFGSQQQQQQFQPPTQQYQQPQLQPDPWSPSSHSAIGGSAPNDVPPPYDELSNEKQQLKF